MTKRNLRDERAAYEAGRDRALLVLGILERQFSTAPNAFESTLGRLAMAAMARTVRADDVAEATGYACELEAGLARFRQS